MDADSAQRALQDADRAEQQGDLEGAVVGYRNVLAHYPDVPELHNNLAGLLMRLGRLPEALQAAEKALAGRPHDPLINATLGQVLVALDRPQTALAHLRLALGHLPDNHALRHLLAGALLETGHADEAVALFREAEQRFPSDPVLLALAARHYHRAKAGADAERCLLRVRELNPERVATYADLANLYIDFSLFSKARQVAMEGLRLQPDSTVLWNTLANAEASVGLIEQSVHSYRKVLELAPDLAAAHSNLLLTLHYVSGIDPAEIFAEHQRFGSRHAPPGRARREFANQRDPERPLRIGYLSPDIRTHSVSFFLEPLLDHRDRDRYSAWCYASVKTPDAVTARLRGKFDHYRSVLDLPCADVARLVHEDEIDILIDLAGHTGNLHAAVLGYKPAPVQVTWLGYPDTTGIEAVDYRITDALADPPGAEAFHVEELVRLHDGFLCFQPPDGAPDPAPPPCLANGFVTFGSFNREFKVSKLTFDLWSRILLAVPGSRIFMKSTAGGDPATREHQLREFERRGVSRDRIDLVGFVANPKEHLELYQRVDIALDTFPYHGTTTTLDSMLMGVPVVTLAGNNHASRVGASLLTLVGTPELIARDEDDYVARAMALAADPERLSGLHATLRDRLLTSPLCDGPAFASKFENALREMWRRWCTRTD